MNCYHWVPTFDGGLQTVSNYSVSIFSGLNQMGIAVDIWKRSPSLLSSLPKKSGNCLMALLQIDLPAGWTTVHFPRLGWSMEGVTPFFWSDPWVAQQHALQKLIICHHESPKSSRSGVSRDSEGKDFRVRPSVRFACPQSKTQICGDGYGSKWGDLSMICKRDFGWIIIYNNASSMDQNWPLWILLHLMIILSKRW